MVQDAKSYQVILELAEQARRDERLRQALKAAKNGEPAESVSNVFSRLRNKHVKIS